MAKLTERLRKGAQSLLETAGDLQERIRERARAIWQHEGQPEGRHDEHWRQAEKEISAEDAAGRAEKEARATRRKKAPEKAEVKSPAAELAARRRPKKSEPTSDAATAQELAEKNRSSKSRIPGKAPAADTGKTRRTTGNA
jgi:DUF2934 family protein